MEHECATAVDESAVRVYNNANHEVKALWFVFPASGSFGMSFSDYLTLLNDRTGSTLFSSNTLVMKKE